MYEKAIMNAVGRIAVYSRRDYGNPVKLAEARRDLFVAQLARDIAEAREKGGAAPLTPEQVDQLTAAIREAGAR